MWTATDKRDLLHWRLYRTKTVLSCRGDASGEAPPTVADHGPAASTLPPIPFGIDARSIFTDLKTLILAAEADPAVDTACAAVDLLRDWLATHETTLVASKTKAPVEFNGTMIQSFHWYVKGDGGHWRRLKKEARALAGASIIAVWLPPASKGGGPDDVGYGTYDRFDLGEFDQKGSVRTKYGTRQEYLEAVQACREAGLQVVADVVFNHKLFAAAEEEYFATPYAPENRGQPLGEERKIRAWTQFRFEGRGGRHSTMQWHWYQPEHGSPRGSGGTQTLGPLDVRSGGSGWFPPRCHQAYQQ